MAACEECGGHDLRRLPGTGGAVFECGLCGALSGDDAAVSRVRDAREAAARGMDSALYELVKALEGIRGVRVVRADGGSATDGALPVVFVAVPHTAEGISDLERIAQSIVLARPRLQFPWMLEVDVQQRLLFLLSPRLPADGQRSRADDVKRAQQDLVTLAHALRRDRSLAWWSAPRR